MTENTTGSTFTETAPERRDREAAERHAEAGAAFMDEHEPGWADRINLDRLDISSVDFCVWGQVYGDYLSGVRQHDLDIDEEHAIGVLADTPEESVLLTDAWSDLIRTRRATRDPAST